MNVLDTEKRAQILACLCEGNSMRATCRLTGAAKKTVERLLVAAGNACTEYMDKTMRDLPCRKIQVDEIWSFVQAKAKNASEEQKAKGAGDVWTWIALDAESKLIPSWYVGGRGFNEAYNFMHDLAARLKYRVQLTSDGHAAYLEAVEDAFGSEIDYAMLVKLYGQPGGGQYTMRTTNAEVRYSPPVCTGTRRRKVIGEPDRKHISTSFVERQNLTLRMGCRRYTRLTNAFSKNVESHRLATAIHFMHYNFCRIHQTLRVTPAMEAGIADHVWTLEEIAALI
jgi:IS1 family transposase